MTGLGVPHSPQHFAKGQLFPGRQSLTSPPPKRAQASPRDTLTWDKPRGINDSLSFFNCVPAQQRVQHGVHSFTNVLNEQGVPFRDGLLDDVQVAMGTAQKQVHNCRPGEGALPAPGGGWREVPGESAIILSCKDSEAFFLRDPVGLGEVERGAPWEAAELHTFTLQSCVGSQAGL